MERRLTAHDEAVADLIVTVRFEPVAAVAIAPPTSLLGGNEALAFRLIEQRFDLGDTDHLASPHRARFRNLSYRAAKYDRRSESMAEN
jgi:hypothetical protein